MPKATTGINFKVENLVYIRERAKKEDRSISYLVDAIIEMERKRRKDGKKRERAA